MGRNGTLSRLTFLFLFLLLIHQPPPAAADVAQPYDRENFHVLFEGQNAIFVCDPRGPVSESLHYQWTLNDTQIIATGRSFTINNVRKSDAGMYKCTVRGKLLNREVVAEQSTFAYIKKSESSVLFYSPINWITTIFKDVIWDFSWSEDIK